MSNNVKKGYFQGATEEPFFGKNTSNNPEKTPKSYPGEIEYSHTELNPPVGDVREWEQKWFEEAATKSKPNLGPGNGEFKLKQEWQRIPEDSKIANAHITAGFTRKASPAESYWTFYTNEGGKKTPIFRTTLANIWGNELTKSNALKSATPKYGNAVLAKIKELGFSKVAYLLTGEKSFIKKADMSYGKDELEAPAVDVNVEEMPMDDALDAETSADLDTEVGQTVAEGEVTVDLLVQKHEEVENAQTQIVDNTAPETTATVFNELQDAEKMLDEAKEELEAVAAKLRSKKLTAAQKIKLIKIAAEAQADAVETLSGTDDTLGKAEQAVKAADAAIEAAKEISGGEEHAEGEMGMDMNAAPAEEEIVVEGEPAMAESEPMMAEGSAVTHVKAFLKSRDEARKTAVAYGETESYEQGKYGVHPDSAPKDGDGEINAAHPDGGHALVNVNVGGKPAAEGEVFETQIEQHEKDLKAVNKMPTGNLSSKAAAGGTVKTASADAATVKFWTKELWGQGDEKAKQFGKDLVKDYSGDVKATVSAAISESNAKLVRAYEIAEVASEKGFCDRTASAKSAFVKEIVELNDSAFMAFKKLLDKAPTTAAGAKEEFVKTASVKIPRNGQQETTAEDSETAFISKLSSFNWSR